MANYDAQRLADKFGVTLQEAERALDQAGGDLLDAAELLDSTHSQVGSYSTAQAAASDPPGREDASQPEAAPQSDLSGRIWAAVRGAVKDPGANLLEVRYGGRVLLTIPMLVAALLLCVAFWLTLGLVALAVLAGCGFALRGPDLDFPAANRWLSKAQEECLRWRAGLGKKGRQ